MFEEIIKTEVANAIEIAREGYPHKRIPMPEVKFSERMTRTGGTCSYKHGMYAVTFSLPIMRQNDINSYASQVVYHEVAHMVDHIVYNGWGHGDTFYRVLRGTFGKVGEEGGRTHSFKTAPKRTGKVYVYKCTACGQTFDLKSGRHSKAQKGTVYRHAVGHPLTFLGEKVSN